MAPGVLSSGGWIFTTVNARLVHPDPVIESPDDMGRFIRREVLYPVQASLPSKTLARIIQSYLPQLPELPEWHRPSFVAFFNASPASVPASGNVRDNRNNARNKIAEFS